MNFFAVSATILSRKQLEKMKNYKLIFLLLVIFTTFTLNCLAENQLALEEPNSNQIDDDQFKYPLDPASLTNDLIAPVYGYWCSTIQCNRACRIAGRGPGRCRYGVCYCWLP
uniref:CSON000357 protein n=1 Tax=Culicoides sonorensis TaxID=179676 RepID=A0A336ME49_CULSO